MMTAYKQSELKQLRCEMQSSDKGNVPLWILRGDISVSQSVHTVQYSVSLRLYICGNSLLKKYFISYNPLYRFYSLPEVQSKGFLDRGAISLLSSPHLGDMSKSHSSCPPKSYPSISSWCTTVFQRRA